MSLVSQVSALATRIGTEFKSVRTSIGTLGSLTTTDKTSIVAAVNEVKAASANAGAQINDTTPSTTTVYSSTKTNSAITAAVAGVVNASPVALDTLNELAAALGNDANFAATTATALGKRVRVDAAQTFTAPEKAQAQTNINAADATAVGDTTTDFVAVFNTAIA